MKKTQRSLPTDEEQFTKEFETWLADRPQTAPTLKAFIARMKPKLIDARAKGVTYAQLLAFLSEHGITCSISTLKAYLAAKRRTKGRTKPGQPPTKAGRKASIAPPRAPQPGVKGG